MHIRIAVGFAFIGLTSFTIHAGEMPISQPAEITAASVPAVSIAATAPAIVYPSVEPVESDRVTIKAPKTSRGTTVKIEDGTILKLCADADGCTIRLGMYDWDNTGRVASRETLFFFNPTNRNWRASAGDAAGSDYNGATEHVINAWGCYMTDGNYSGFQNNGDGSVGFSLLSWSDYNGECWLTIID